MGNKAAKRTNKMLGEQTARAQQQSERMGQIGEEERGFGTGLRSDILGRYQQLYGDVGGGGYGGGGGGYPAFSLSSPKMNEAMQGYRYFANQGGFTPEEASEFRGRATATLPSYYEALKNQLESQNAVAGGFNVGFNPQMAKLAREKGRGASEAALGAEVDLSEMVRKNKLLGLEGVSRLDREYQEALRDYERARMSYNTAAAGRAAARASDAFREKMSILGEMRELRQEQGTDLPYWGLQQRGTGQAIESIGARVPEKPWWQTGLEMAIPAASAFIPGLGGGGRPRRRSPDLAYV